MKNTFVKVLSLLMALMMAVGVFSTISFAAECTHANATPGDTVAPKCNAVGYTWYTCNDCGESFKGDYTPVSNVHDLVPYFGKDGVKDQATCTENAWEAGLRCKDCGHIEKESYDLYAKTLNDAYKAKGHIFGSGTITSKTYCTDKAEVVHLCLGCGVRSDILGVGPTPVTLEEGTDHEWNPYVVKTAPTLACDSTVVERTCKNCPAVETSTTPQSHSFTKVWTAAANVTGYVEGQYCGEYLSYKQCEYCSEKSEVVLNPNRNAHGKTQITNGVAMQNNAGFVNWCNANGKSAYLNSTSIGQANSCYAEGWALYYCAYCNTYYEETLPKAAHTITWTTELGPADGLCTNGAEKRLIKICANFGTNKCDYKEIVSIISPAVHHIPVVDTNTANTYPATCAASGKTTTICQTCKGVLSVTYTPALGHTWDAYYYSDVNGNALTTAIDCTKGIYQARVCTVCGARDTVVKVLDPCTKHEMSTGSDYKIREATCSDGEYGYYYCKNSELCAAFDVKKVEGTINNDKRNPNNHVPFAAGMTVIAGYHVAPTCTTAGQDTYVCTCGVQLTKAIPATGHLHLTDKTYTYKNAANQDVTVAVGAVTPTCTIEGFDAGWACTDCNTILVPRTSKGFDAAKHTDKNGNDTSTGRTPTKTVAATCVSVGYTEYIYDKCCFATERVNGDSLGDCATKQIAAKAPDCLTAGTHKYTICTVCKKITNVDIANCTLGCTQAHHDALNAKIANNVVTEADLALAPIGHAFTVPHDAKPETCDEDGHTAYFSCAHNCGQRTGYAIVRAHSIAPQYFAAKPATCFEAGVNAGWYCPKCINIPGTDDYNNAHAGLAKRDHQIVIVPVNKKNGVIIDCTLPAYDLVTCGHSDCGYVVMDRTTFVPAKAAHNWNVVADTHDTIKTENTPLPDGFDYACWASGYTSKDCAICGQASNKVSKNDQIKHYYYDENGNKVEIDTSCTNIAKYDGIKCALCGLEVKAADNASKKYVAGGTIGADHNFKWDKVNAEKVNNVWVSTSCTEYGYVTEYCVDCKKENVATQTLLPLNPTLNPYKFNETTQKIEYNDDVVAAIIEEKAAKVGEDGFVKYVCAKCDETHTFVLPAISALAATATVSSTKVAAGETFTVTYALSGVEYTFAALDLQATIPANMTLTGIKSEYEGLVAVVAPTGGIVLVVPNDANGNAQKVTTSVEGTALFTLTYTVNKTAITAADQTITITDVTDVPNHVTVAAATSDKIAVTAVGNLNGDTIVSAEDAQAIFAKIGTNDLASDVNCDGIVNTADVIALAKFAASTKTGADYLEMVGELDKLEDEVFALLDSGKLNDVNGDKVVNITDAYELIADVNTALTASYTALGNKVTMNAVVAYWNVHVTLA